MLRTSRSVASSSPVPGAEGAPLPRDARRNAPGSGGKAPPLPHREIVVELVILLDARTFRPKVRKPQVAYSSSDRADNGRSRQKRRAAAEARARSPATCPENRPGGTSRMRTRTRSRSARAGERPRGAPRRRGGGDRRRQGERRLVRGRLGYPPCRLREAFQRGSRHHFRGGAAILQLGERARAARRQASCSSAERPSALVTSSANGERSVSRPRSSRRGHNSAMSNRRAQGEMERSASSASCVGTPLRLAAPG